MEAGSVELNAGEFESPPFLTFPAFPQLAIVSDSQIHNREDLIRQLGLPFSPASETEYPDPYLLLAAFRKWDIECPRFLLGEFSFVIQDQCQRRLFCCRDHLALRPFFYAISGSRFAFAGDQQELLRLTRMPRELNVRKLAAMKAPRGQHLPGEETFYQGISALPPGTSLIANANSVRLTRYWDPAMEAVRVPDREEEAFDALRELLTRSVANRMRGADSIGALLSGGLDSSALVCLAASTLRKSNRTLTAIAAILPESSRGELTDERTYIEEFRNCSNVDIQYVTAEGRGPFDDIDEPDKFVDGFTRTSRFYIYDAISAAGRSRGLEIVLDGVGGEMGPTFHADSYYLELAVQLRWGPLASELSALRKTRGISPLRMLGSQMLNALSPGRGARDPLVMLNPAFTSQLEAPRAKRRWPNHRRQQADLLDAWLSAHASPRGQTLLGGMRFHYPFVDKRIIEFCLAAPGSMKVRHGYQRYMLRRALDGMLPKRIQWRTGKHPVSPDYYVRFNAQIAKARSFTAAIGPRDPVRSVVDVERLGALLQTVDPVKGSRAALVSVPATIYLICFLRQFAAFRL